MKKILEVKDICKTYQAQNGEIEALKDINFDEYDEQNFKAEEKYAINVKIAINTGDALIGQIGSSNVSDFTVMGDTVDIIDRIADIGNEFNKNIIVTQATLNQLDVQMPAQYMGQVTLKNTGSKIKIFELKSSENYTDWDRRNDASY